jgi:hypothetical protein
LLICRRQQILAKYPEIKKLYGPCPYLKYKVLVVMTIQVRARPSIPTWRVISYCGSILYSTLKGFRSGIEES